MTLAFVNILCCDEGAPDAVDPSRLFVGHHILQVLYGRTIVATGGQSITAIKRLDSNGWVDDGVCKDKTQRMSETEYARPVTSVPSISFRKPRMEDGVSVWRAVEQTGTLEQNTAYFYAIFCSDFSDTCLIAEQENEIAGFVIGYHPPSQPGTAFCWQIGVLPHWRGHGLGQRLLRAWLDMSANRHIEWITATVAVDNAASSRLFKSFSQSLGVACDVSPHFSERHFPPGHSAEPIYRIGPFVRDAVRRV